MKGWFYNPKARNVPEKIKLKIELKAKNIIDSELKKKYLTGKPKNKGCNYIADIYCKWVGNRFYLCSKYNCPFPRAVLPSFETKFARLEYIGDNKFQLFFMRHTGKWIKLYEDIRLEKAFKAIKEDSWFRP
ncbi:MAG: hypothetical protein QME12_06390 [Nanoarchaeota archaeon]|nr:hypothetical protein [Nanoarchaeota archaeon]